MTLIILTIAWLLGIVAADYHQFPAWLLAACAVAGVIGAAVAGSAPRARLSMLALACAALGAGRYQVAQVAASNQSVWLLNDTGELAIEGTIAEDPRRTTDAQRVLIAAERARVGDTTHAVAGMVLAKLPPYPERRYGDRLRLTGALSTPREAERAGQFDYRAYLARKRIFSLMEPTAVRAIGARDAAPPWAALLDLRDRARKVLLREFPEPQASLAVGILLGLQSTIPADVSADFSATGTSHILVISGWNLPVNQYHLVVS